MMSSSLLIGIIGIIGAISFMGIAGVALLGWLFGNSSATAETPADFVAARPMSNSSLYNRVQLLEARVDKLYAELNLTPPAPPSPDTDTDIRDFVLKGQKINAIKLYRERYGVGLKEAKDIIDQMARDLGA